MFNGVDKIPTTGHFCACCGSRAGTDMVVEASNYIGFGTSGAVTALDEFKILDKDMPGFSLYYADADTRLKRQVDVKKV